MYVRGVLEAASSLSELCSEETCRLSWWLSVANDIPKEEELPPNWKNTSMPKKQNAVNEELGPGVLH